MRIANFMRPVLVSVILCSLPHCSCLGHKEFRFLLPILPLAMHLCGLYLAQLTGGGSQNHTYDSNAEDESTSSDSDRTHPSRMRRSKSFRPSLPASDLPCTKSTFFILLLVAGNLPLALYTALIHQRGTLDVMRFIHDEASKPDNQSIAVMSLMPCHSIPHYRYILCFWCSASKATLNSVILLFFQPFAQEYIPSFSDMWAQFECCWKLHGRSWCVLQRPSPLAQCHIQDIASSHSSSHLQCSSPSNLCLSRGAPLWEMRWVLPHSCPRGSCGWLCIRLVFWGVEEPLWPSWSIQSTDAEETLCMMTKPRDEPWIHIMIHHHTSVSSQVPLSQWCSESVLFANSCHQWLNCWLAWRCASCVMWDKYQVMLSSVCCCQSWEHLTS